MLLLALVMAFGNPASVLALNEAPVIEAEATDLSDALDYDWKVSTNGSMLTIEVTDARAGASGADQWSAIAYLTADPIVRNAFTGTTCTMTYDFAGTADGLKTLRVMVFVEGAATDYTQWTRDIYLKVSGGQVSIYNPYGQPSIDFLNQLNATYNPADYSNPASLYMMSEAGTSYDEIVALAKELTAGKTTDAEKVLAIHDWICSNCAYDRTNVSHLAVNTIEAMYQNRYGVCEHFSQLTTLMCRAVGVPCITISGVAHASLSPVLEDGDDLKSINHAWNAVYYNNSWHFIDNTWDCANRYYGAGDSKNTTDKEPGCHYFDLPAALFGTGHYAKMVSSDAAAPTGIVVKNGPRTYFVGQPFSTEYEVCYVQAGGDTSFLAAKYEEAEFYGYDSSREGEQIITVRFKDFTTQFTVTVCQKTGIKAVPKEGVTYKEGEFIKPQFTLYYTTSVEGVLIPIADIDGVVLGYNPYGTTDQTVTVEFDGYTTAFQLDGKSVGAETEETETAYDRIAANPVSGYIYLRGENFTPQYKLYGIKGSTQEEITDLSEVKLTFDKTQIRPTVTVAYKGLTTTFDIATTEPTGIVYTTSSVKFNVGDEFAANGVLKYQTTLGNKEAKEPEPGELTFSGYDMSKAGKQTVTVTYKVYSRTYTTTYEITVNGEEEMVVSEVTLDKDSYTYTGKAITPVVTVVDADGKKLESSDYSVVYSNNKNVGTAKVTITFQGDYAENEEVVKTFTINPKGTKITKVTAGSKKLTVEINEQKTETSGYEVRYSLKKKMKKAKTVKITDNDTTSTTISKLKGGKKYFVQVRTYKTVSGTTYYSDWSKKAKIKTLK